MAQITKVSNGRLLKNIKLQMEMVVE